jgi:hypothetical protein
MKPGVLGLIETVRVTGKKGSRKIKALVDTGAEMTSLDIKIAEKIGAEKIVRTMKVKAPATKTVKRRPVVNVDVEIGGERFRTHTNLNDRSHMRYSMIIGRNILRKHFVVDVAKSPDIKQQ